MHKVIITGTVGTDLVLRTTASGKPVTNFNLAYDKVRTSRGQTIKETQWYNVVVWGAEAGRQAERLTKGSQVLIEGEGNLRTYKNKEGHTVQQYEIIAHMIQWLYLHESPKGPVTNSAELPTSL